MKLGVSVLVAASALAGSPAFAWGPVGHQIVAYIAAGQLTPKAKAQVGAILGGDAEKTMVAASTWPDEVLAQRPDTVAWHFVYIPLTANGYDAARDCQNNDCLVAQIEHEKVIIADPKADKGGRAEALKFLINLVGDIHEPLNTSDNMDHCGADQKATVAGFQTSLRNIWDVRIVQFIGGKADVAAKSLSTKITPALKQQWSAGTTEAWANESFQISKTEIYPKLPGGPGPAERSIGLGDAYLAAEDPIAETQLEKAGTRLAWVLNQIFH